MLGKNSLFLTQCGSMELVLAIFLTFLEASTMGARGLALRLASHWYKACIMLCPAAVK